MTTVRRDVLELRAFYATPLGAAAHAAIAGKLAEAWGDARGLDLLGLGYATPYLGAFSSTARRTVASMSETQGVEVWPAGSRNLTCLAGDLALPFPNALFDRVLVIHGLEESDDPTAYLEEVRRVMSPSGRMIAAVAARRGLWAGSEATPFGHGRPFSRSQLEATVRAAGLEPVAWSRCLYAPPLQMAAGLADTFEQVGSRLWPPFSGLILLEAVKQTFALLPKGLGAPVRSRPVFAPQPAPAARDQGDGIPPGWPGV